MSVTTIGGKAIVQGGDLEYTANLLGAEFKIWLEIGESDFRKIARNASVELEQIKGLSGRGQEIAEHLDFHCAIKD